ncbi:hypothetical protein GCK72_006689 [Caenorhabditis remanei]|uniref:Uncharacterized protein n=1 Tax=Caenorhabditis remanei TaxID=31234 RepID=A0A6A5HI08_CAERE|nr:hypothetical protein GCK72_006689 [Caenorhabditis remanei]KAF1766731.1 hypothetical protein GCK72_006689 [Caenorhabditis remanei]
MAWFLCQWFEAILAKLAIMPYQTGLIQVGDPSRAYFCWWTRERSEMLIVKDKNEIWALYISSCFLWHYIYSAMFAPIIVGVERLCATYYIQDYENIRRRHIPILLILVTNIITIPYAYFVINNQIPFLVAYAQCVLNASIVFFGYLISWKINVIWRNRMDAERIEDHSRYSLARKFQVGENIRYLLLARRLVIAVVIYLSISLIILAFLVFGAVQGYDILFVYVLDNVILSAALVVSFTWIFCSSSWKEAFLKGIPCLRRFRKRSVTRPRFTPNLSEVPEGEVYFIQLKNAWV